MAIRPFHKGCPWVYKKHTISYFGNNVLSLATLNKGTQTIV